jgi:hypothetical protein
MSRSVGATARDRRDATRVQQFAGLAGLAFLLVGVLGFVPGITGHYDRLALAGHESGAALLGVFEVSILHNGVHLLFGIAGLALARGAGVPCTGGR